MCVCVIDSMFMQFMAITVWVNGQTKQIKDADYKVRRYIHSLNGDLSFIILSKECFTCLLTCCKFIIL